MAEMTPLMKQYWEIKSQHLDKVVFFRMGDFYEMFHSDAETAAPILNIQLTQRNKKAKDETKMCGVPYHSVAGPIGKLLARGLKVAIAEQIEDPKLAKGIVKRAVTRVLTPGMVYDPATLDEIRANYIASFDDESVSALDVSTGEAFFYHTADEELRARLLELLKPSEVVVYNPKFRELATTFHPTPAATSAPAQQQQGLPATARCLLSYVENLQGSQILSSLLPFEQRRTDQVLHLGPEALRALEIFENARGDQRGTLFESFHRFKTAPGARLFRSWLQFPRLDLKTISQRHDKIEQWLQDPLKLETIRTRLSDLGDIERRLSKTLLSTATARDLLSFRHSLHVGLSLDVLPEHQTLTAMAERIAGTIVDEPPAQLRDGGFVRGDIDPRLTELQELASGAQAELEKMEAKEREATGISSLKIRFNSVFGFYIEVTNTHLAKVPSSYVRKQTLTNAERFTTQDLEELEGRVLSAQSRRLELELQIFADLQRALSAMTQEILFAARAWAELDVVTTLAWLAIERKYVRPQFVDHGIELVNSRHPALELLQMKSFTPNSVRLNKAECILLTGPNMAGKSTLMRQVALAVLLAQAGSFVAADRAQLPLIDGIFTRIGSSDALSDGLSTFMVEMTETAKLLKSATPRSLILLDEIGRGTSTYDGLSLAQALLEHLVQHTKAYLFFATHYHELTAMASDIRSVRNMHMLIKETGAKIEFLHTLVEGAAGKSYGIHVARLAGLPLQITERANQLLKGFEKHQSVTSPVQLDLLAVSSVTEPSQCEERFEKFKEKVTAVDLNRMTPVEALVQWQSLQHELLDL